MGQRRAQDVAAVLAMARFAMSWVVRLVAAAEMLLARGLPRERPGV